MSFPPASVADVEDIAALRETDPDGTASDVDLLGSLSNTGLFDDAEKLLVLQAYRATHGYPKAPGEVLNRIVQDMVAAAGGNRDDQFVRQWLLDNEYTSPAIIDQVIEGLKDGRFADDPATVAEWLCHRQPDTLGLVLKEIDPGYARQILALAMRMFATAMARRTKNEIHEATFDEVLLDIVIDARSGELG